MKFVWICFLSILHNVIFGQGYFQATRDQSIALDKFEIQSGSLFDFHLQIKPLNKGRCLKELMILRFKMGNQQSQFKPVDKPFDVNHVTAGLYATDSIGHLLNGYVKNPDTTYFSVYNWDSYKDLLLENSNPSYLNSSQTFIKYFYKDGTHFLSTYKKNFQISLDPLLYFEIGREDSKTLFINRRGLRIQGSVDQKIFFHSDILETQLTVPAYVHDYVDLYKTFPGAGLYKTYDSKFPTATRAYDFLIAEAAFDFKASEHIQISLGHGRHFIGSGIRSLFLSDFAAPHFYLQINTNIWKFHYQNLYTELSPESYGVQGDHLFEKKYMASHYLSVNLTKNWNAGLFESVVFARKNGFELQYLNPVILYRFVEHSLGSPDNEFIGFHSNALLAKKFSVYGQILFDEFVAKEFFSSRGWWGNKYGFQLGCKYINAFGLKNLFLQLEYNQVRPYTYSFRDSIANYAQFNQALAHPLGANFKEQILSIHYQPAQRWTISSQLLHYNKGLDSTGINSGGNILLNYDTRISDYGNTTTQGISNEVWSGSINISYRLFHRSWLDFNLNYRSSTIDQKLNSTFWFSGGFRMNLDRLKFDF